MLVLLAVAVPLASRLSTAQQAMCASQLCAMHALETAQQSIPLAVVAAPLQLELP